jgi:hypothetical protein
MTWSWFLTFSGVHSAAMAILWGGLLSCLGYLSLVTGGFRHINCHEKWCPRIGKHEFTHADGVTYKVCAKHHPAIDHKNKPRASDFARHHASKKSKVD